MRQKSFLLVCVLFTLGGCSSGKESNTSSALVYCSEGNPETFNPQLATSGTTFDATARTVYNRLVELNPATSELSPSLASAWSTPDDGKTWRLTLRADVSVHSRGAFVPSRKFNADDVVFSFERQRNVHHPFHKFGEGYPYFQITKLDTKLRSVRAISPLEVEFALNQPDEKFLDKLSMEFASILSAEYADWLTQKGMPQEIDTNPVGTGPFTFELYKANRVIRFKAFENHFAGAPALSHLIFAITPDASLRLGRLRSGECQVISQPSPAHHNIIDQTEGLTLNVQQGMNVSYWAFNTTRAPFDDVRVRQALNFAVNRNVIIDSVYGSSATLAEGPVPTMLSGAATDLTHYAYDPTYAQTLLQQAHYPFEREIEIWAMPVSRPYNPNAKKMAELIQQDLMQIGVKSHIVSFEWREFLRRVNLGEHDSVLMGWTADIPDAENFLEPLLTCQATAAGSNRARWCHEPFDAALSEAKSVKKVNEKFELLKKAQHEFKQQAPWLPIAHGAQSIAMQNNVKGVRMTITGGVMFHLARIESR